MNLIQAVDPKLKIEQYLLPKHQNSFLAVWYVIRHHGPVIFTNDGTYIFPQNLMNIINFKCKISNVQNEQYLVEVISVTTKSQYTCNQHWRYMVYQSQQSSRTVPERTTPPTNAKQKIAAPPTPQKQNPISPLHKLQRNKHSIRAMHRTYTAPRRPN